ncbi:Cytochrome P450 monooxygenase aclL [Lachnellula suecica]|uniref:tRNA-intron lyase n=1 Tax=Lachnellula suecica TaxID=602035 RepID=A0A8T9BWB5_9HELO|nr:Cytochrome P450 monooxygenase aclL [Lachnellula suecica]
MFFNADYGTTGSHLYPLYRIFYNVYFSPLANLPGPKSWSASRLPFILSLLGGNIVKDVEKIHRKYGKIVRIAPNEISFAHVDAWTEIFQGRPGHAPYSKDPVWWGKQPGQAESLLSANTEDHARMKKLLGHGLSQRALKSQEAIVQKYVDLLIERLKDMAARRPEGAVVDMVPWFNYTTFDIFGDLAYGEPFDCLQHSAYHPWITTLFKSVKAASFVIAARFYPLIDFLLMKCIPLSLKQMAKDHISLIEGRVERRLGWEVERPDLMSHIIKHNNEKEGMTLEEIQATFIFLTTAGSETTATALSGTLNYLAAYPDKMAILVKELRDTFARDELFTLDKLQTLPYLNAVLNEGLRLCPPVPIMLPRVVPDGGDTICGVWLPGGTSISLQAWTLFRDPFYFHDPTKFHPERWLPEAAETTSPFYRDQRQAVQAFSVGPRSCLGKPLAWAEMRLILGKILWTFNVEPADQTVKWEQLKTFLLVEKKPIEFNSATFFPQDHNIDNNPTGLWIPSHPRLGATRPMAESYDAVSEPIPISVVAGRYLLFDINVVTYLRRTHNICGVLIGGIPQVPQQNVFLGLPLELIPEEVKLLVEKEVAYLVDDNAWHAERFSTLQGEDRRKYLDSLRSTGLNAHKAKDVAAKQRSKAALAKQAIKQAHSKSTSKDKSKEDERPGTPDSQSPDTSFDDGSESLFSSERPSNPTPTPSSELKPYFVTPTTSYIPSLLPENPSPPADPAVTSSYPLFAHLHSRGYYIMPGLRFGGDYNVYPGDPLRFHSHFIATGFEWEQEIPVLDLIGGGRLGTAVKKGFMIGGKDLDSESGDNVRTFCVEWAGM